ncbi:MAG: hypothetical protein ACI85O_002339 [Saprospiraceae bacterium]|jgi:hypothetical protein
MEFFGFYGYDTAAELKQAMSATDTDELGNTFFTILGNSNVMDSPPHPIFQNITLE